MRKNIAIALSVTLLTSLGFSISAQAEKPEVLIDYRQSVFDIVRWHFKPMGDMVKGTTPFDKAAFAKHAEVVAFLSKQALEGFVDGAGSSADEQMNSEAKPVIWEKWDDFKTKMESFQTESAALAELTKTGNEAALKAQFGKTGKTCKACHDDYRVEDKH